MIYSQYSICHLFVTLIVGQEEFITPIVHGQCQNSCSHYHKANTPLVLMWYIELFPELFNNCCCAICGSILGITEVLMFLT